MRKETIGGLTVTLAGGTDGHGGGDGPLVILLHGFGAPGDDLVGLAPMLEVPEGTRFAFPQGPLELGGLFGGARAWWMLDLEALERQLSAGETRDRSDEEPEGLREVRARMAEFLAEIDDRLAPADGRVVLGGFSQGAMVALDTALHQDRPLSGLVLLSGTLLASDDWIPRMPARAGLPVLQSHGRSDPLLPFSVADKLHGELERAGLGVEWGPFPGGHEVPPIALESMGRFLRARLG